MKIDALRSLVAAVVLGSLANQASAFTGQEVMEVFSTKERGLYIAGVVDATAYSFALNDDVETATCISDWYWAEDNGAQSLQKVEQAATQFPDHQVYRIVAALIKRACPSEN